MTATDRAAPSAVRYSNRDTAGQIRQTVTLRYRSRLHHIGVGRAHTGRRVVLLVADRDVRVLTTNGELLRHLELDPTRDYQRMGSS